MPHEAPLPEKPQPYLLKVKIDGLGVLRSESGAEVEWGELTGCTISAVTEDLHTTTLVLSAPFFRPKV